MEIDDTLKNRLAGTAVVTVLAIIFLPMLFDSPVEKKGQVVSELGIPQKPEVSPSLKTAIIPDKTTEVASKPKAVAANTDTAASEDLAANTEKPGTASEKVSADSAAANPEAESPTPAKKKMAATETADDESAEEEPKPSIEDEKPKAKTGNETKPSKPKLPVLDATPQNKNAATPPALENRRWVVQVASLNDEAKATAFRDKLRAQGFPATVESAWINGKGRVYRLKVGPELDAQKAQATKAKINQLNNVNSIAIPE